MENPYFARELAAAEHKRVEGRRKLNGLPEASSQGTGQAPYIGLALSGGGIRSATFCLGVCQHLAKSGLLRRVDFLSTVSGGGFLGGFLGAWINRAGFKAVEQKLHQNDDPAIRFLRENGRYIVPNGSGDVGVAVTSYLRGWLAVLGTLALAVFATMIVAACIQEWLLGGLASPWLPPKLFWYPPDKWIWPSPWFMASYVILIVWVLPLGFAFWLLGSKPLRLTPPIWAFVVLTLGVIAYGFQVRGLDFWPRFLRDVRGLLGIPLLLLGAMAWTQGKSAGKVGLKVIAIVCALGAYFAFNGFHLPLPWQHSMFSPAVVIHQLASLASFELPWHTFDLTLAWTAMTMLGYAWVVAFAVSSLTTNMDFVRRKLTELTAIGLWAVGGFAVFAVIDTLGGTCLWILGHNGADMDQRFHLLVKLSPAVTFACAAAQKILQAVSAASAKKPRLAVPTALLVTLGATLLALCCLVFLSLGSHFIVHRLHLAFAPHDVSGLVGSAQTADFLLGLAVVLLLLSCCVGHTRILLNLSSDLQLYTARLTRAYLGATNPKRQENPAGANVTQPVDGDDVPLGDYHPDEKGGPLHVINVTINETISGHSNLDQKDRHGYSLAVGPSGLSIGRYAHAIYDDAGGRSDRTPANGPRSFSSAIQQAGRFVARRWRRDRRVRPLPGPDFHPLARDSRNPEPQDIEMPTLGSWVSISGAAFSTGLGQQTSGANSFLAGFFNIRLGYWWNSNIAPWQRKGRQALGFREWIGVGATEIFPVQCYLLDEFLARFHGPAARRLWNLTDGGHFENTAVYELVRRRVRFIVVCDCGEDHNYLFEDIAVLTRKARIDFSAEITFFERAELDALLDPTIAPLFGDLDDFAGAVAGQSHHHAALARIEYLESDTPVSYLLVLKPTMRGDEPKDLLDYHAKQPTFPQQPTSDQFFDEAQWESYRRLGALVAERVFAPPASPDLPKWRPWDFCSPQV